MDTKISIRKRLLKTRKSMSNEVVLLKSSLIVDNLKTFLKDKSIRNKIHVYLAIQNEPDLTQLYRQWLDAKYELYAPVVKTENLLHSIPLLDPGDVTFGPLHTIEPVQHGRFKKITEFGLILVPGVAFDIEGNRLGFGKGFYDRFLAVTGGVRIGLCYDFQLLDRLPVGKNDLAMDVIVTDKRVLSFQYQIKKGG